MFYRDQFIFTVTYYTYYPFLTCEVKCDAAALDIPDWQDARSINLAVRGVIELFRAVKREDEVNRQILAFSVSHDHQSVRIRGHCVGIDGKNAKYYRHPIPKFDFADLDGRKSGRHISSPYGCLQFMDAHAFREHLFGYY